MGTMQTELIESVERILPFVSGWDQLAAEQGRPYCSPSWMLSWWRHLAPGGARLAVVVVRDGDDLVAIAPFFADRRKGTTRYRLLASRGGAPTLPLARTGMEQAASMEITGCLGAATFSPDLVMLDGVPASSGWTSLLREGWGVNPARRSYDVSKPLTGLTLRGRSFEEWMDGKSSHFRKKLRRLRRRLEEQGAVFRMTSRADELGPDLRAFMRLHEKRWESRGGSAVVRPATEAMLTQVAHELLPQGRFRLWSIERQGEILASEIYVSAGGTTAYWLGGFDDAWAEYSPGLLTMLSSLEHAWQAGDDRVEFGAGDQDYKNRFAEDREQLDWSLIIPPGRGSVGARMHIVDAWVQIARGRIGARLPDDVKARLRRLSARVARR